MLSKIKQINSQLEKQKYRTLQETKLEIPIKANGFYWIYTKLPIEKLIESATPINQAHVDISLMASTHQGLKYIIKQTKSDYWCIYNGKGTNLKQRISAAFTNTNGATGKLALTRVFKDDEFRVKFVVCNISNTEYGIKDTFDSLERDLERVWRLNYGWPILCRT
ncbi:hypothetical protein HMPREF1170_03840 [Aeromonas veronii AMC35]|uniref:hypothetical protein n=1 Tax=Aeromonas veronii TaxID=654 RepID=UPI000280710F|nr:hypothetical protein [Aeromonas veronii]EKB19400.1 hypothetical protein HMPREF1170_03840 [Aeromonas veronii AMC35]